MTEAQRLADALAAAQADILAGMEPEAAFAAAAEDYGFPLVLLKHRWSLSVGGQSPEAFVAKTREAELALAARQAELAEGLLIRAKQIAHDYYASHMRMPPLGIPLIGRISTWRGDAMVGTSFTWRGDAYVFIALIEGRSITDPLVAVRVANGKVLHMTAAVWCQIAPQIDA